jgi:hypothetical protein
MRRPIDKIYTDKPEYEKAYSKVNELIDQVNMLSRLVQMQDETIRNLQKPK